MLNLNFEIRIDARNLLILFIIELLVNQVEFIQINQYISHYNLEELKRKFLESPRHYENDIKCVLVKVLSDLKPSVY